MPESAEVKINAEQIKPFVQGHYVQNVNIYNTSRYKSVPPQGYQDFLNDIRSGKQIFIEDIKVSGKFLYWVFSDGWYLMNTFGMTGQWSQSAGKHPCISIDYTIPPTRAISSMFFNDPRHFGTIKFTKNKKDIEKKLKRLGWDPFSGIEEDTAKRLKKKMSSDERNIAHVLLDQSIWNGVGNYIKCEALYASNISPHRKANLLSEDDIYLLCEKIVEIVNESYKLNGATISTYKSPDGKKGEFSDFFKVYGKKKDPFGNNVIKEELSDGRTTHWVPTIQK